MNPGFIQQYEHQDERYSGHFPRYPPFPPERNDTGQTVDTQPVEEKAAERRQDEQWIRRFLQNRTRAPKSLESQQPRVISVPQIREVLYGAAGLISKLSLACQTLRHSYEDESVWIESYGMALEVKRELQEKLRVLDERGRLDELRMKVCCAAKKRSRRWRRNLLLRGEKRLKQMAEKEAAIDKWRMKQIQEVEEKKMERELKLAADSVLCEVRKKQADVKRMQDVLRSLEKLRRLRKEAASRKGIFPDQESDVAFSSRLEQLRAVMGKRTTVYSAEEKALRVMLEGEQEEERRRDAEKRQRKERERQLQRKQEMDTVLFGDVTPAEPPLQPFRQYYTQAEHSLPALLQIRREWDVFVVAVDHPDGSAVPQGWVLPDPPSDRAWASVLHNTDSHS
ncbi:programmed cell death protein 7-like [Diretmus argenteus]